MQKTVENLDFLSEFFLHAQTDGVLLFGKAGSIMRGREINVGTRGDDSIFVDCGMASVVVSLDVRHVDGVRNARNLVDIFSVVEEIWVLFDCPFVALEMYNIHLNKTTR